MSDLSPARERLALALDVEDLDQARRLAAGCSRWFATVKVGLQLFAAAGPQAVELLAADGFAVFVDLKLHDIPATVGRAAEVIAGGGASYTTVHTVGGEEMLTAAVAGLTRGSKGRQSATVGLGVTALTSENASSELVARRAKLAAAAGLGGIVCAVGDLAAVKEYAAPGLFTVVPGIRAAGDSHDDQRRVGTPQEAVRAGADLLVVGRSVTAASDPSSAAAAIGRAVEQALSGENLVDGGTSR